jgi:probable rRNA maturation factor
VKTPALPRRETSRLHVDVASHGVRVPLAARRVASIVRSVLRAERLHHALVSVAFVDRRAIARLNRRHIGHTGSTDVISFGLGRASQDAPLVGDVYIAPEIARENARRHHRPVREELARLIVHGTLHALGYEHPDEDSRTASPMWRRQERLVKRTQREGLW